MRTVDSYWSRRALSRCARGCNLSPYPIQHEAAKVSAKRFTTRGLLGVICIILLCGILYAGLYPFHVPENQVTWIAGSNAVRLGEHGTIFGFGSFPPPAVHAERSIEIWAQPRLVDDSSTLLAFYSPDNPHQLWLSQSASDLEIQTQPSSGWRRVPTDKFYIDNAFQDREHTFWTLTFGKASTAVYRNGALVRRVSYRISGSDLSGQLVIGNSPIFHESWSGVLHGLAVYDKALDPTQIERHYTSWRQRRAPTLDPKDACIALYLFDEHAGNVIHNKMGTGNDLYIPQKFVVLRQTLLDPVWRAFRWSGGFWKDTFINIAGFIPFGCFFFAYFSAWGMRSSGFRTALLGASVSLFIEITQAYLPTRDSSMSDVITNTIGAVLGVLAYRGIVARALDRVTLRIISVLNG